MADKRIKVGLSEETLTTIDTRRGLVPRETWLRALIEQALSPGLLIPEPKPSKPVPPTRPSPTTPLPKEKPVQPEIVERRIGDMVLLDHPWIGNRPSCMRVGCPDPRNRKAHL